jgi:type IV pilus assembly protein PilC
MEFRCRLSTPGGEITEGIYVADSESRLRRELEEKGLYVLSLQRRGALSGLSIGGERKRKISRQEFLVFNQELATLLKAGMPLVQSLDILRQRVQNATFKGVLDAVHDRVKAGTALSDAFAEHQGLFPGIYTASLMAGERSGNLDAVIRRYVAYEKIIGAVKRRTISALIYPAILVAMMFALVGIIVVRVVPAFSGFYANFDRELPFSTQIIVGVSNAVVGNMPIILAAVFGTGALALLWVRQAANRARLDHLMLALPWAGETIRKFATSQLARTLGTLLGGGIPLVNALEIASGAMTNRYMAAEIAEVTVRVREGQSFAAWPTSTTRRSRPRSAGSSRSSSRSCLS